MVASIGFSKGGPLAYMFLVPIVPLLIVFGMTGCEPAPANHAPPRPPLTPYIEGVLKEVNYPIDNRSDVILEFEDGRITRLSTNKNTIFRKGFKNRIFASWGYIDSVEVVE